VSFDLLVPVQGVSLVLWAYQAWRHHPQGATLAALAAALRARIAAFKPAELAACLQAFSALGFHPGNDVIQVPCLTCLLIMTSVLWGEQAKYVNLYVCMYNSYTLIKLEKGILQWRHEGLPFLTCAGGGAAHWRGCVPGSPGNAHGQH
jgi:hypothetical protein